MDIKWQMAMLSVRVNKFKKKAGRKIEFDKKEAARDDESFAPKVYGMVAGCGAACEEGVVEVYCLITGNGTDAAAGEVALMGMTSEVNLHSDAGDEGIVDSGCSHSMTGNKERLDDFYPFRGGKVTFGGGEGRITGKGTIRTPKLDFENVYYMKELQQFNLFSVSRICDKKNRVLFIDTDCLVLSKDFKLPDESMVLLRVPRKHNLYTFNLRVRFFMEALMRRTATTPYEAPKPKSKNEPNSPVNVHLYRSMIGSLMYWTASRPDIMFAVSACSRNQVAPTTSNLEVVKKIFK
ncbi:hypothetical protein Tco_1494400, partial [Tanacetum coccineum]